MRGHRFPFKIHPDNEEEIKLICDVIRKTSDDKQFALINDIVKEALVDAVDSVKDTELAIRYLINNHPEVISQLGKVIKEKYPQYEDLFNKLAVLT